MPQEIAENISNHGMRTAPVIIAGAGPVGLALALGLAHHGVRSIVLEKKDALSPHSKALGILTRTLEVFRAWGCLDQFLAEGAFASRLNVWVVGRPSPQATIDLRSLSRASAIPGVLFLPQDRTESILLGQVSTHGLTEVCFGHEVTGFQQDGAGVVVQVYRAGQEPLSIQGSYLIGCDGAHSVVRSQLGWHLQGKTYPSRILLMDVHLEDQRDDLPWPRLWPQSRGALAALRYKPGFWRIIATLNPEEPEASAMNQPNLDLKVERLFGPGPYERIWASVFHIHRRTSPHFRQGRVVLAGDAAHINSPAGGQGMNSGIQDAHNLAWKLARALKGGDAEVLLTSYEQERRAVVVQNVERFTDMLTRLMLLPRPYARAVLLRLLRLAIAQPSLMSRIAVRAQMLDVHYKSSALISGEGQWLGVRAPDGEIVSRAGVKQRLLDLVEPGAALVLFDDGRLPGWSRDRIESLLAGVPDLKIVRLLPQGATIAENADDGTWRDVSGQIWRTWAATGDTAALIRPDGHVGWIAQRPNPDDLCAGVKKALGAR